MARPGGLEPPTPCLEGRCSIRLSYGRKDALITWINWGDWWGSNPRQPESQSGALPTELQSPWRPDRKQRREIGRGREIWTPDILLPKQARYQTALYPDRLKELLLLEGRHNTRVFKFRQSAVESSSIYLGANHSQKRYLQLLLSFLTVDL